MKKIQRWWQAFSPLVRLRFWVLLILIIMALFISIAGIYLNHDWAGLLVNFGTGLFGSVVTFVLIDLVLGRREQLETERQVALREKARLIARLASKDNQTARQAAEELRQLGWLTDGSLQGIDLRGANLQKADLNEADLRGAILRDAKLQEAHLKGAKLNKAFLQEADLQGAILTNADLSEANLWGVPLLKTDLSYACFSEAILSHSILLEAVLSGAALQGANLKNAYLGGAYLGGTNRPILTSNLPVATFNEATILPDGTNWTAHIDMEQFTDQTHPNFWKFHITSP